MAMNLIKQELDSLRTRSENYIHILKAVTFGVRTFSQIRDFIYARFGSITDQTLSNNLSALQKMSFLEVRYEDGKKLYTIPDPMIIKTLLSV